MLKRFTIVCNGQVCSKAKLMDATAYLLERSGDILGAFKLIKEVYLYFVHVVLYSYVYMCISG